MGSDLDDIDTDMTVAVVVGGCLLIVAAWAIYTISQHLPRRGEDDSHIIFLPYPYRAGGRGR